MFKASSILTHNRGRCYIARLCTFYCWPFTNEVMIVFFSFLEHRIAVRFIQGFYDKWILVFVRHRKSATSLVCVGGGKNALACRCHSRHRSQPLWQFGHVVISCHVAIETIPRSCFWAKQWADPPRHGACVHAWSMHVRWSLSWCPSL